MRAGETRVLIDAGLSRKEIFHRLRSIGEDPEALNGIVITHEHCDHVCGLIPVLKKQRPGTAVYLSHRTAPSIFWGEYQPAIETFQAGERFHIGCLDFESFTIPHDAADPVGFTIRAEGLKIGFVTDLGYMPDSIRFHLRGTDFLALESNHDLDMLKVGPYPWSVKQRVMGRKGHLSNDVVSSFITDGLDSCCHTLLLGHLSEQNNHPEIVRHVATRALQNRGLSVRLVVADPGCCSDVFEY